MKWPVTSVVVSLAALAVTAAPDSSAVLDYEVVSVERKLLLETEDGERAMQAGDHARSGDVLRTGSRSRAELAVSEYAARFAISAKTSFRLAHDTPGVLIEVDQGRLRAIFGKLPDGDSRERLVATPSAILAVRGTEYGIDVEKNGETKIFVFEGTVEAWERGGAGKKVRLQAGQTSRIRKGRAPSTPKGHGVGPSDWDRGRRSTPSKGGLQQSPGMGSAGPGSGNPGARSSSSKGGSKRHGG
jgi:hypothetical protein